MSNFLKKKHPLNLVPHFMSIFAFFSNMTCCLFVEAMNEEKLKYKLLVSLLRFIWKIPVLRIRLQKTKTIRIRLMWLRLRKLDAAGSSSATLTSMKRSAIKKSETVHWHSNLNKKDWITLLKAGSKWRGAASAMHSTRNSSDWNHFRVKLRLPQKYTKSQNRKHLHHANF
jgi:hypothetical protein